MSRKHAPWLAAVAAAATTALTAAPASADVLIPIGPNQYFESLVKGQAETATILTDNCHSTPLGVLAANPVPGQTVSVQLADGVIDADPDGFTGALAHAIDVQIPSPPPVVNPPVVLHFYNMPVAIPASFTVPCSGSGTVTFEPTPLDGGHSDTVAVTFMPIPPPPSA